MGFLMDFQNIIFSKTPSDGAMGSVGTSKSIYLTSLIVSIYCLFGFMGEIVDCISIIIFV